MKNQRLSTHIKATKLLSGQTGNAIFSSYILYWKVGGFCKLDPDEPTNFRHHHNCWEGHFVLSGNGKAIYDRETYILKPLSLTCTPPEMQHEIQFIKDNKDDSLLLFWFLFDIEKRDTISVSQDEESAILDAFLKRHMALKENVPGLQSYLEMVSSYTNNTGTIDYWINRITKEMILYSLVKLTEEDILNPRESPIHRNTLSTENANHNTTTDRESPRSPGDSNVIETTTLYIYNNLDKRISIETIARICGMSTRNIQYIFKNRVGTTFTRYVSQIKANQAARALLRGVRVQQAGKLIGIPDSAQFSRFFKKYYGVSPTEYKSLPLNKLKLFSTTFEDTGHHRFI